MNTAIATDGTSGRVENATIYRGGGFGFRRTECRWVEWETKPYAQHASALHVRFVEKGKRNPYGFVMCGHADAGFVIVRGHGHPVEFSPTMTEERDVGNGTSVVTSITRHCSFDPAWTREFRAGFAKYIATRVGFLVLDTTKEPRA
jgi:hypothetical protein